MSTPKSFWKIGWRRKREEQVDGYLRGISLSGFLQLLELEKSTCTLTVEVGDAAAQIFVKSGRMLDATTGRLNGLEAALEVVGWENPEIWLTRSCTVTTNRINQSMSHIVLEGMRLKDEFAAIE